MILEYLVRDSIYNDVSDALHIKDFLGGLREVDAMAYPSLYLFNLSHKEKPLMGLKENIHVCIRSKLKDYNFETKI